MIETVTLPENPIVAKRDTIRLTAAQDLVRYLSGVRTRIESAQGDEIVPLFGGVFAIFGHGNVAGIGEALYQYRDRLPTYRAHNEQAMAHAAIAYAKAHFRRRMMACTTSIGPGATNLLTAAALAHVNRLPVLFLPGDIFISRDPDPVLQQVENLGDGTGSANDCFRPVSRYFDRIVHPSQLITSLPRAVLSLTDPALCGPVTLALPQDVQAAAFDYPIEFFESRVVEYRAVPPNEKDLAGALRSVRAAKRPVIIAVGTRLADFTTGSNSLFTKARLVSLNVNLFDATKARGIPLQADARLGLEALSKGLTHWKAEATWTERAKSEGEAWRSTVEAITQRRDLKPGELPYDGEVIGAVQRSSPSSPTTDIVVCAAGTLPAELHKLWRTSTPGGYHMEYGYSCMGYEIAGGLGVKMARPDREVIVMLGDGSYLMLNSEIATSLMLDKKLIIVVLDNRGYGCINRLQQACGGEPFNNLFVDCVQGPDGAPRIDFAAHAASLGALAENVETIPQLEAAMARARAADRTYLICIETNPDRTTAEGGCWWEVAVPEVSDRVEVRKARHAYEHDKQQQKP